MQLHFHLPDFRGQTMSPAEIKFYFNDQEVSGFIGQSVGAALLAQGDRILRKTRFNEKGRGVFCGIGVCFDCLVVIDGISNQRACITEIKAGMKVQTQVGSDA
jgi:predicted molibdopterin-dependent oxidoreductase YjgC